MEGVDLNSFGEDGSGGGGEPGDDLLGLMDEPGDSDGGGQGGATAKPEEGKIAPEEDGNPDNPEDGEGEPGDDPVMEIIVDGQPQQMKLSELTANAQKYLSGDRRLEQAAEVRKALEPERAAIMQERMHLHQALNSYVQQAQEFMKAFEPDWQNLLAYDPAEYTRQRHAWDARLGQINQALTAQQQLQQRAAMEQATQNQARAGDEKHMLLAKVPEWRDPAKAREGMTAISGYLTKEGYSDAELNTVSDHRMFVVARKAMLYDQLLAKKAEATQRVQSAPKATLRPGVRQSPTGGGNQRNAAAYGRFAKNPSVDTLADVIDIL